MCKSCVGQLNKEMEFDSGPSHFVPCLSQLLENIEDTLSCTVFEEASLSRKLQRESVARLLSGKSFDRVSVGGAERMSVWSPRLWQYLLLGHPEHGGAETRVPNRPDTAPRPGYASWGSASTALADS